MAQRDRVMNLKMYNQQPYHFGFILALNQMHFTLKTVDSLPLIKWTGDQIPDDPDLFGIDYAYVLSVNAKATPGFTIGILGSLLLHQYIDMRFSPSLSFGERVLTYHVLTVKDNDTAVFFIDKNITSTLLDFPLDFKYRSKRLNNFGMYVLAGVKYSLDLASQKKAEKNNGGATTVKLNKSDIAINVGVGAEFYTQYFKFGVEAKMGYGMFNLIKKEGNLYSDSIDKLNSKVFLLSFTFE
jgi:hypothetical protein